MKSRLLAFGLPLVALHAGAELRAMVDRNADGVSDLWSERFAAGAALDADPDGDGMPNRAEAAAGTDPLLAESRLAALLQAGPGGLVCDWPRVAGKCYTLETSADLVTWAPLSGVVTTTAVALPAAEPGEPRRFVRVTAADADTDLDGLDDWEEAQVGTDPALADTDGDGASDHDEVLAGTNPLQAPPVGTTYHLDAVNGSDEGDGSAGSPWKTFKKALFSVQSGDTVLLYTGDYGRLVAGRTKDENVIWGDFALPLAHFTDWVTFKPAPGQTPRATQIDFGTRNTTELTSNNLSVQLPFTVKGNVDLFIRIEGLIIEDGVKILGGKHIEIAKCTINRVGDLSGSVANLDNKLGVNISNGRYITIRDNDITHVSIGIGAASHDLALVGNRIHHISHDGIRVWGGENWLIEGNWIHNLDDGVRDPDLPRYAGVSWNRHADGIHIWTLTDATHNLTVRGNVFYHIESMGVMLNASTLTGRNYSNFVFENNVFGPTGGELFHGGAFIKDRFLFRHNTIVYAPNDQWVSIYPFDLDTGEPRVMTGQRYLLGWPTCDGEGSVYNNLFADGSQAPVFTGSPRAFTGHNLYRLAPSTGNALSRGDLVLAALPYDAIPGNVQDFMNATGKVIGQLTASNQAIDAGTGIGLDYVTALSARLETDCLGNPRDNRADIGAFEVQGRNPVPEVYNFLPEPAAPLYFVDNFTDTRLDLQDPFLNTADTTGILWHMPEGYRRFRTMNGGAGELVLSTVYENQPALVVTSKRFANIVFAFDFFRPMNGCGVVMLFQDPENYYYYNFGGSLVRRQGGGETVVATVAEPSGGSRGSLAISFQGTTVTLAMSIAGAGVWTFSEVAPFTSGAVGFYRNRTTGNGWDRSDYDNVRIELATPADMVGDLVP